MFGSTQCSTLHLIPHIKSIQTVSFQTLFIRRARQKLLLLNIVAGPFDNGYGLSRKYTLWAARAHLRTFFVLQPGVKVLATASRLNKIFILKHKLLPL